MRILLLSDNFVPETNSPALRAFEHARAWTAKGERVAIITTIPNFPTGRALPPYRNKLYQKEILDGIEVVRVWSLLAPNRGVLWRSLDFLSFALSGFVAGLFQRADVIVATSPQLLTALAGCSLAIVKRRPWVFEVRDLWPDSIVAVGVMRENLYIRVLQMLETWLYRRANRIVAVSDGIRARLIARGVPAEKIGVVPNGVNLNRAAAATGGADERLALGLEGRFVVGYVGTHGMAQGLEVALGAAQALRDSKVHFLFVGEGARRDALVARAAEMHLNNVTFIGLVPLEKAAAYLNACDAVLIPLKRTSQIEITLPGKIFEAAAMGKPIIVSAEGASADLVRRYGAGLVSPPEDSAALAVVIHRLIDEPELRERMCQGSLALAQNFDRDRFATMLLAELQAVVRA